MLPTFEDQCSLPKGKEKKKQKKRKRKEEKKNRVMTLGLEPEHGPRGVWRKPLKPDALSLNWLGVVDLVFVTWVDR